VFAEWSRIVVYVPGVSASIETLEELRQYIEGELKKIADETAETIALELRPSFVAPERPREGMIVCADGASWNPGSGAGAYEYKGGLWVKL
jgi:hypothetical protein